MINDVRRRECINQLVHLFVLTIRLHLERRELAFVISFRLVVKDVPNAEVGLQHVYFHQRRTKISALRIDIRFRPSATRHTNGKTNRRKNQGNPEVKSERTDHSRKLPTCRRVQGLSESSL
jgi:hypothetical protein